MGYGLTMGWDFLAKPWFDERTSVFMRKIKDDQSLEGKKTFLLQKDCSFFLQFGSEL
jgi:hypothetical protein